MNGWNKATFCIVCDRAITGTDEAGTICEKCKVREQKMIGLLAGEEVQLSYFEWRWFATNMVRELVQTVRAGNKKGEFYKLA